MKSFEQINRTVEAFVVALDRSSSYSLDRIKVLLDELGNPQDSFKAVHIAGTSGKTSTAYYTAAMLETAGYKVGLSVSPYVEEMNERVQLGITPLNESIFCREFTEFFKIVKRLSIKPTYFELFVVFAYWYFSKIKVDYAVIEVGLGGLLDGTNTMERPDKICIITDISLDHTHVLGKTIVEIARQKAGIIKNHNTVFMYHQGNEVEQEVIKQAQREHAMLRYIEPTDVPYDIPAFQKRNWNLAKNVCGYVFARNNHEGLEDKEWEKAAKIVIPGRLETIKQAGKTIILDGAHNSQKIQSLAESFRVKYTDGTTAVLLAVGENKAPHLQAIAETINGLADFIVVTAFEVGGEASGAAVDPKKLAGYFDKEKVLVEPNLQKAAEALLSRSENTLLVTGSLYLVGAVRKILRS